MSQLTDGWETHSLLRATLCTLTTTSHRTFCDLLATVQVTRDNNPNPNNYSHLPLLGTIVQSLGYRNRVTHTCTIPGRTPLPLDTPLYEHLQHYSTYSALSRLECFEARSYPLRLGHVPFCLDSGFWRPLAYVQKQRQQHT